MVTLDRMFNDDLNDLRPYIEIAQRESFEMGRRISRSFELKKKLETVLGKMRNDDNNIVDSPVEQTINHLIRLLGSAKSSVSEIEELLSKVDNIVGKEPFALVELDNNSVIDINVSYLPYGMLPKHIADTLKYYEVRHRKRLNWTTREIYNILRSGTILNNSSIKDAKWIYVWYDPAIGLPPNIRLPAGMNLPVYPCELCIPKL